MEHYYRSIISGERAGVIPALLRFTFAAASLLYGTLIRLRNLAYDLRLLKTHRLPVPVISVGNITTGGTGKTPTVIMICKELQRLGRKPAVLTRGYGAAKGQQPDEVLVIRHECPGVPVIVNPDRVAGGREAVAKHAADTLVLDDGFQHRRLHRDLDIVLVDATEPLGVPGVLPRGTWREPPAGLARAHVLMLTRCEQVQQQLADFAAGLLTQWVAPRRIFQQHTHVLGIHDAQGRTVPLLGQTVIAFAGIGNPGGFLHTVQSLGLKVSAACWFADHHNYTPADFAPLQTLSDQRPIDAWVTTLKDAVKLAGIPLPRPLWTVRIESQIHGHASEVFRDTLAHACTGPRSSQPQSA